ncbi:MAG TPA: hypothetical protein VE954_38040 [Oligoflexus sp.]|uniref:hypothetical protein n=1 Tax=Oligoflexus sp. TaxID=1971216 RepID=UPI002D5E97A6|nr:hypothetical protein [Oligoflexus sp.]HYX38943.1 hypothetical protein [Oligoflexus sp.]
MTNGARILSGVLFLGLSWNASANMMPFHEGIMASGNLTGEHPQLQIIDEQLNIQLYQRHARVQVQYQIQNSGAATRVETGFPSTRISSGVEISDFHITSDQKEQPTTLAKAESKL